MQRSSYIAALAASGLAAALVASPHTAAAGAHPHKTAASSHRRASAAPTKRGPARSLAQMDLTPRDYLVRPYAPAYQAGDDRAPLAIDYHFAGDGVMSLGLHRGSGAPANPILVDPSLAYARPTTHNSLGALVTYNFP